MSAFSTTPFIAGRYPLTGADLKAKVDNNTAYHRAILRAGGGGKAARGRSTKSRYDKNSFYTVSALKKGETAEEFVARVYGRRVPKVQVPKDTSPRIATPISLPESGAAASTDTGSTPTSVGEPAACEDTRSESPSEESEFDLVEALSRPTQQRADLLAQVDAVMRHSAIQMRPDAISFLVLGEKSDRRTLESGPHADQLVQPVLAQTELERSEIFRLEEGARASQASIDRLHSERISVPKDLEQLKEKMLPIVEKLKGLTADRMILDDVRQLEEQFEVEPLKLRPAPAPVALAKGQDIEVPLVPVEQFPEDVLKKVETVLADPEKGAIASSDPLVQDVRYYADKYVSVEADQYLAELEGRPQVGEAWQKAKDLQRQESAATDNDNAIRDQAAAVKAQYGQAMGIIRNQLLQREALPGSTREEIEAVLKKI